jgi:hypothetical protein
MRVGHFLIFSVIFLASLGLFLFLQKSTVINVNIKKVADVVEVIKDPDIGPQQALTNPPEVIKAIYATSWSAASEKKLNYLIDLIKTTELNAIVIDIKDYTGYITYNTELDLPKKYNAVEIRTPRFNSLIKRLHDEGIYVIVRISVFQDQRLPLARPDLALVSSSTGETWKDFKGLMWMDTASREVWDYNIAIAKEVLSRGVDEVNFDYIRFPSDGNLNDIIHPFWDEKTLKTHIVRNFFKYLREQIPDRKISADLFGLVTVNTDGLGIGQHLEYALPYFDVIAPMVYPSHYFKGFIGYENPAEFPYEIVAYSMDTAVRRIKNYELGVKIAKLRPWFQDFDLGADYDAQKVRAQIQAWDDATVNSSDLNNGWMLWNPGNVYTREALVPELEL